jgi:V/A-type H+-transporting ATPase subunit D
VPRLNIAPTRRNYFEIQRTLARVRQGHDLLDKKRQILVTQLMSQVEAARRAKEEAASALATAYEALGRAQSQVGTWRLAQEASGIAFGHGLAVSSHSVMGVPVPRIECKPDQPALRFSLMAGGSYSDEVMCRFLEALPLVARLAEVENAVVRLAREIRRTQRRVNALEKIYIPLYVDSLRYIEDALEERQREEFVVLRKVKQRHARQQDSTDGMAR